MFDNFQSDPELISRYIYPLISSDLNCGIERRHQISKHTIWHSGKLQWLSIFIRQATNKSESGKAPYYSVGFYFHFICFFFACYIANVDAFRCSYINTHFSLASLMYFSTVRTYIQLIRSKHFLQHIRIFTSSTHWYIHQHTTSERKIGWTITIQNESMKIFFSFSFSKNRK